MDTILITGGAGFIGSRLALGIREAKPECRLIAFDNLIRRGSELNVLRLDEAGVDRVIFTLPSQERDEVTPLIDECAKLIS